MPRKPYIPLEIQFVLGFDEWKFTSLSVTARGVYITLWSYLWHDFQGNTLSRPYVRHAQRAFNIHHKTMSSAIKEMINEGLVRESDDGYKFLGLNDKRIKAYRGKGKGKVPEKFLKDSPKIPTHSRKDIDKKGTGTESSLLQKQGSSVHDPQVTTAADSGPPSLVEGSASVSGSPSKETQDPPELDARTFLGGLFDSKYIVNIGFNPNEEKQRNVVKWAVQSIVEALSLDPIRVLGAFFQAHGSDRKEPEKTAQEEIIEILVDPAGELEQWAYDKARGEISPMPEAVEIFEKFLRSKGGPKIPEDRPRKASK